MRAPDSDWPITLGTSTAGAPLDTTSVIDPPMSTSVPTDGLVRITSPAATSLVSSVVTLTLKLYGGFSSSERASASVRPTTICGTACWSGPADTTMLIVVACSTCSPAGGSVRMTEFSAIESLSSGVIVPIWNPAVLRIRWASSSGWPSTLGISWSSLRGL